MGIRSSRYTEVGDEHYNFNRNGFVDSSGFRTGDLIFFSERFPKSKIKRLASRWKGKLWNNCGIVIHAPNIFGDQMLILEHADVHPDDHLKSELHMSTVHSGYRLVNLHSRLNSNTFEAIGVRKLMNGYRMKQNWKIYNDNAQQVSTVNTIQNNITKENKDNNLDSTQAILNVMKDLGYINVPYVNLNLNEMTGRTLNKYTKTDYTKTHITQWPRKQSKN